MDYILFNFFVHAGVAVPSAVERKELQQFPIVKEVVICYYIIVMYSVKLVASVVVYSLISGALAVLSCMHLYSYESFQNNFTI